MGQTRQQQSQPELQQPEYDAASASNDQFQGLMQQQGANRQNMINQRMRRQQVMQQFMPQWMQQGQQMGGFMGLLSQITAAQAAQQQQGLSDPTLATERQDRNG